MIQYDIGNAYTCVSLFFYVNINNAREKNSLSSSCFFNDEGLIS